VNVLRSLARELATLVGAPATGAIEAGGGSLAPLRGEHVPPVLGLGRFLDGFEQLPGKEQYQAPTRAAARGAGAHFSASPARALATDGFERAVRRPVDLCGGVRPQASSESLVAGRARGRASFAASLDDLGSLLAR
jgi:hypothetical protein